MELLDICDAFNVDNARSSEWIERIKRQYSGENRHFHNLEMLQKKLLLVNELAGDESFKNALILATIFQYYHYDVKKDLKHRNCDEFKLFVNQVGIKDVSRFSIDTNLELKSNLQESLVTATLTMLQDESIPSDDESAYQTEFFNDLDLAVLGWEGHKL